MMNILSLFDHSGEWPRPYLEAGHAVWSVDLKRGHDVSTLTSDEVREHFGGEVDGILAAPPCTHFTVSGAQYWAAKDADGRTDAMLALVDATLRLVGDLRPRFWALENPVGRLATRLRPNLGRPKLIWQPHWYGDAYTKRTCLWGDFNADLPRTDVDPVMYTDSKGNRGSWHWAKLGGKSEKTKALRSVTPAGFARAFFEVNQ